MTPALRREAERAVQVVTIDGRRIAAGRASLFVLDEIGWGRGLARLARRRPFVWAVELGYRAVAANRDLSGRFLFRGEAELARSDEQCDPERGEGLR